MFSGGVYFCLERVPSKKNRKPVSFLVKKKTPPKKKKPPEKNISDPRFVQARYHPHLQSLVVRCFFVLHMKDGVV